MSAPAGRGAPDPDPTRGLALSAGADGRSCRLAVRVQPGAGRRGCAGIWNDRLRVAVHAPPEDGRANRELERVLAELLGLRRAAVRIERGHSARNKIVAIDASVDAVRERILSLLPRP